MTNSAAIYMESPVLHECCPQRRCVILNFSQMKIVKPFCTSEGTSEGSIQAKLKGICLMLPITTTGNNIHLLSASIYCHVCHLHALIQSGNNKNTFQKMFMQCTNRSFCTISAGTCGNTVMSVNINFMLTFKVILLVSCLPETWKDEG